jgi:hypothetical protein
MKSHLVQILAEKILPKPFSIEYSRSLFEELAMLQQTNFQALICSLNISELQTLILQLSESDASLSDHCWIDSASFPRAGIPNAPQWDPKEILAQVQRL